jgi:outer membrane protein OmpA-like peptidoglycan-associated protein
MKIYQRLPLFILVILYTSVVMAQDFRVQAAAYADSVKMSFFKEKSVEKIFVSHDQLGLYRYFVGDYQTREEAEKARLELVGKGFPNATIIDLAEQRILCGANCPYFREGMVYVEDPNQKNNVFTIYFESGSSAINAESKLVLNRVAQALKQDLTYSLRLMGHTDGQGDKDKNLELATARARAARNYIQAKGIRPDRLFVKVYGEADPIAQNQDFEGKDLPDNRKLNRRVVMALVKEQETPVQEKKDKNGGSAKEKEQKN